MSSAEMLFAKIKIFKKRRQIAFHRFDQVVINRLPDTVGKQCG